MNKKKINIEFGKPASFTDMMTLMFIGLKLGHVINWSWVWVLAPTWIDLIGAGIITGVILFINRKGRD